MLVTVVMLLALSHNGQAQQPGDDRTKEPQTTVGAELVAINQCVREVPAASPKSEFDAHVGTLGTMRYVEGADADIAAFKRCMAMQDFPLEPK